MTVAELLKTLGVPLHVWMWLERYAGGDKHALQSFGNDDDAAVVQTARLVYDVLNSAHEETGMGLHERKFPEEARDFIEEWLYKLCNHYRLHAWSDADLAVAALPTLLLSEGIVLDPEGDSTFLLLRSGVERLTTKHERRAFLRDAEETDAEHEKESATNWRAAFKLSRVLADPRTPRETRDELELLIREFSMSSRVTVEHPALVKRAFLLMCEAEPQRGRVKKDRWEMKNDRRKLLALLDTLPDEDGGAQ
jgi:hypothetical protein